MYLLYDRRTAMTGRVLRRALGCRGGMPRHFRRNYDGGPLIRWGSSATPLANEGQLEINRGEAVALAAHKLASLRVLQEHDILVPPFSEEATDLEFPVFRRDCYHAGGRDIHVIAQEGPDTLFRPHGCFFTQFVPSVREMRLHIAGGELIRAQIKRGEDSEFPIRNHTNGYTFVPYTRSSPNRDRVDLAVRAVSALGLDFGAVDVLVGTDNRAYVLEVNTAASCSPRTAGCYLAAFQRIADDRGVALSFDTTALESLAGNALDGASEEELDA